MSNAGPAQAAPRLVAATTSQDVPAGRVVTLDRSPFVIGRAMDADLHLQSGAVARRHLRLEYAGGRWWVEDLGSTNGTRLNGQRVKRAPLAHGDVLEAPWWRLFVFEEPGHVEVQNPDLERALLADPDDDGAWSVYADWLAERAAPPLGVVPGPAAAADAARLLGPLSSAVADDEAAVEWAHGVPVAVRLASWVARPASTSRVPLELLAAVEWLAARPQFRFLRRLELDVASFRAGEVRTEVLGELLRAMAAGLPALEVLRVGPTEAPEGLDALGLLLEVRRARNPRFTTTPATLTFPWQPAELELASLPLHGRWDGAAGARVPVPRGSTVAFGGPDGLFSGRDARGPVVARVRWLQGRWLLEAEGNAAAPFATVGLNGRRVAQAWLRSGDVFEPVEGLTLRFRA